MSESTLPEASFKSLFARLDDSRYLFDVRKIFEFAEETHCELVLPQQEVENNIDVSTAL